MYFLYIRKIILHPFFVYAIIAMLSCIKRDDTTDILYEMPRMGDNFRTHGNPSVYYFNGSGKYIYTTPECYFSYGNPPFDRHYSKGGIKIIADEFAYKIPFMGNMCEGPKKSIVKKEIVISPKTYLTTNYLLANFSELAHLSCYLILALSILFYLQELHYKYWLTFALCFIGGGILELVQKFFIFGRQASWEDMAINSAGALTGMFTYWLWRKKYHPSQTE